MSPQFFGPYRVIRLIGQGGMGMVYEAIDPAGRTVAVKTLSPHLAQDETMVRRFEAEIETLRQLQHPNIVRLEGSGVQEGLPFFAMEFVPGSSLESLLQAGRRFTSQQAVAIAQQIVPALKFMHDNGVVHRDLKPANVMFPPAAGGVYHVKLTDFGIAKLYGESGLTRSGSVVGTPEYMAPEQAACQHVDRRTDLYNLGLLMYAMLSGKPPFHGAVAAVLENQKSRRPPPIDSLVRDVPKSLADLIEQLLEKSPGRRPNNATIVANMLADIRAGFSSSPLQTASAVATPEPREGPATTVVADATEGNGHHRARPPGRRVRDSDNRASPNRESTFRTVEDEARAAQFDRLRKAKAARWNSFLTSALALVMVTAIVTGGYVVLRPAFFPNADETYARIVEIINDSESMEDECRWMRSFLTRFPADQRADDLRRIGREIGLDRLQKQMRREILRVKLGLKAKSYDKADPHRDDYRDALHRWLIKKELKPAAEKFAAIIAATRGQVPPASRDIAPCEFVDGPDPAAWGELARRQLEVIGPIMNDEDAKAKGQEQADRQRAAWMLTRAVELQAVVDNPATPATERVIAIVQRHQLLEQVEDTYADEPHCTESVAEARRLLGNH